MKRHLVNLVLCVSTIIVVLVVAEIGLHQAGFPCRSIHGISQTDYEKLPGMYHPNTDIVVSKVRGLPHRVRINSLGFRGPEVALGAARPRVLFIGDSFTYGDGVDEESTLPARVARRLGRRAEVLNGGVAGSTIVDQRLFLKRMLALRPRMVVLVYSENDLIELRSETPMHERLAENRRVRSGTFEILFSKTSDLCLANLVRKSKAVIDFYLRDLSVRPMLADMDDRGPGFDMLNRYAEVAAEMRDFLASRQIALLVAAYPSPEHIHADQTRGTISILRKWLDRSGIKSIDLRPALAASGLPLEQLYFAPVDYHPAPAGYEVVAAELVPRIENLLAESIQSTANRSNVSQ